MREKIRVRFIIYQEDEQKTEECIRYLNRLYVPEGVDCSILVVSGEEKKMKAYMEGQKSGAADFFIFLEDKVLVIHRRFLLDVIGLFLQKPEIGIMGISGYGEGKKQGKYLYADGKQVLLFEEQGWNQKDEELEYLYPQLLVTREPILWKEAPSELAMMKAICQGIHEKGKKVVIPYQRNAWCLVDAEEDTTILKNIEEILVKEEEAHHCRFVTSEQIEDLMDHYQWLKQELRGIEYDGKIVDPDFVKAYRDGLISFVSLETIMLHETIYLNKLLFALEQMKKKEVFQIADGQLGKHMNIVTSINRKYLEPMCVMLESLWQNNQEVMLHIYILHSELMEEDRIKICKEAYRWNAEVTFMTVDEIIFDQFYSSEAWTKEAYFRLLMINMLPKTVDRVLYLDVDVIIGKNIYDFYFSDFEGNDLIACTDMGSRFPAEDYRDVMFADNIEEATFQYCNSGVTLWNIEKLRERNMIEEYMQIARDNGYQMKAPDQDLINKVHAKKIKVMNPFQYNLFAYYMKDMSVELAEQFVSIIHYSGPKPWMKKEKSYPLDQIWWRYARDTSFYKEEEREKGVGI